MHAAAIRTSLGPRIGDNSIHVCIMSNVPQRYIHMIMSTTLVNDDDDDDDVDGAATNCGLALVATFTRWPM